jgi:hypothetical protein
VATRTTARVACRWAAGCPLRAGRGVATPASTRVRIPTSGRTESADCLSAHDRRSATERAAREPVRRCPPTPDCAGVPGRQVGPAVVQHRQVRAASPTVFEADVRLHSHGTTKQGGDTGSLDLVATRGLVIAGSRRTSEPHPLRPDPDDAAFIEQVQERRDPLSDVRVPRTVTRESPPGR